jgi:PAS domain S-box-containing protein
VEETPSPPTVPELRPGDHICGLFETEDEYRALLVAFVRGGLERGEKVLCLIDSRGPDEILDLLRAEGIDVEPGVARGQLRVAPARKICVGGGDFDAEARIACLAAEADRALAEGFSALRLFVEMTWFFATGAEIDSLLDYEAKLDAFFGGRPCLILCEYDRRLFDPAFLLHVVATHPIAAVGGAVYENPSYVSPQTVTQEGLSKALLRQWIEGLASRRQASENLQALRSSEERYRMLFDRMLDGFALFEILRDGDGRPVDHRILEVNPAFEALTGLSRAAVVGRTAREVLPDLEVHWIEACGQAALTGKAVRFESYSPALGKRFEIVAFLPREGQFAVLFSDVTERRRIEEALRNQRDLTKNLVEASPAFFVAIDGDGKVILMNPAMLTALGYSAEEVKGKDYLSTFVPEAERRSVADRFQRLRASTDTGEGDNLVLTKDGAELLVEWRGRGVFDGAGRFEYLFGLGVDVTERRLLEEQFRQAQKMEAVGRLAGGVAHDFNNLLTAILGYCDLALLRIDPADPLRRDVEEIRKAGERAAGLTRQLLAFSRRQVLQPRLVDLNEVVADVQKMLARLVGEDVEIEVRSEPGLGLVRADPGQLQQVIVNLAVNARDAMPEGGRLTLETANVDVDEAHAALHGVRPGPHVVLSVSDTGHGLDDETREHLFEPFFTTKEPGKGTGLGLATVHGIVTQSGGHIEVLSRPGHGATFLIFLPRAEAPPRAETVCQPIARARGGTETVLVVEDSDEVRRLACEILTKQGYRVLAASGGEAAVEVSRKDGPIHLLLTDVVMPGMSGRSLAERLCACSPRMKVLFMSGYADRAFGDQGGAAPGFALLQKPFHPEDLVRRVRTVLDEA